MNVARNAHSSLRPLPSTVHSQIGTDTISYLAFPPPLQTPGSIPPMSPPLALLHPRKTLFTTREILIANPRLESGLSCNDSSRLQISNRERIAIFPAPCRMAIAISSPASSGSLLVPVFTRHVPQSCASLFSSFQSLASSLQNPCPPCGGWRLIVTPRLESRLTLIAAIPTQFLIVTNRAFCTAGRNYILRRFERSKSEHRKTKSPKAQRQRMPLLQNSRFGGVCSAPTRPATISALK